MQAQPEVHVTSETPRGLLYAIFLACLGLHSSSLPSLVQVAMSSLESTLLKWSVKSYLLSAGLCHLATGEISNIVKVRRRIAEITRFQS